MILPDLSPAYHFRQWFFLRGPVAPKAPSQFAAGTYWRRHPKPFSKSRKGKARRSERRFVRTYDFSALEA